MMRIRPQPKLSPYLPFDFNYSNDFSADVDDDQAIVLSCRPDARTTFGCIRWVTPSCFTDFVVTTSQTTVVSSAECYCVSPR